MKRIQWQSYLLRPLCVFTALALGFLGVVHSAEPNVESELKNIGFMKNPPPELKARFPMCDAFLNVEWIDKEKMIGYANYEALVKDEAGRLLPKRKNVWALVQLKGNPTFDADVYQYKIRGQLPKLFEKIRKGKVEFGVIKYEGEDIRLSEAPARTDDEHYPLLSNHRQTVCIAYPDEQRVWIPEGKSIEHTYTEDAEVDQLIREVKEATGASIRREYFKKLWVLDVNNDGRPDFVYERLYLYSTPNGYRTNQEKFDALKPSVFTLTFPETGRVCVIGPVGGMRYITTDGSSYFISGICDLTAATSLKQ